MVCDCAVHHRVVHVAQCGIGHQELIIALKGAVVDFPSLLTGLPTVSSAQGSVTTAHFVSQSQETHLSGDWLEGAAQLGISAELKSQLFLFYLLPETVSWWRFKCC